MTRTTVVLADDHHLVRQGLRTLLEAEDDFGVIGEEADGLKVSSWSSGSSRTCSYWMCRCRA